MDGMHCPQLKRVWQNFMTQAGVRAPWAAASSTRCVFTRLHTQWITGVACCTCE